MTAFTTTDDGFYNDDGLSNDADFIFVDGRSQALRHASIFIADYSSVMTTI